MKKCSIVVKQTSSPDSKGIVLAQINVQDSKSRERFAMIKPPAGVRCVRPGNPTCAHPTRCANIKRCYYEK